MVKIIGGNSGVKWEEQSVAVAMCYPYVVSVGNVSSIEVYHLYEAKIQKANIEINNGKFACATGDRVYVASKNEIAVLTPIPIKTQITAMILTKKISEAFGMFERTFQGTKEEKKKREQELHIESGFVLLFDLRFNAAFEHFEKGGADPRDILFYFPDLLPNGVTLKSRGAKKRIDCK